MKNDGSVVSYTGPPCHMACHMGLENLPFGEGDFRFFGLKFVRIT